MRLTPPGANDQPIQPDQATQTLSLGSRLRQAREASGQTLEQIAAVTRISLPILAALENDDPGRLPSAVACRAFVKIYAEHLGLTSGDLLAQLAKVEPRKKPLSSPAVTSKKLLQSEVFAERQRLFSSKKALPTFLIIVLLLVGFILYRAYFSGPEEPPIGTTTNKTPLPQAAAPKGAVPGPSESPAPLPAKTFRTPAGADKQPQPPANSQPPSPSPLPAEPGLPQPGTDTQTALPARDQAPGQSPEPQPQ